MSRILQKTQKVAPLSSAADEGVRCHGSDKGIVSLTKDEFKIFTEGFLSDLVAWAEIYLRRMLPRDNIQLIGHDEVLATGKENVVNFLTEQTYLSENKIKPCADLVFENFDSTMVIVKYIPSGHEAREFGINWNGSAGPYIKMINMHLVNQRSNREFPQEWGNGP